LFAVGALTVPSLLSLWRLIIWIPFD
jgi:hypothetical protein